MNVEAIQKTIELLETSETYNQREVEDDCGSPGCVAGHLLVANGFEFSKLNGCPIYNARRCAELTPIQGDAMFGEIPEEYKGQPVIPTKQDAVDMLKRFVRTGKIEWRKGP